MATPPPAPVSSSTSEPVKIEEDEVELRSQVRESLKSLTQREPLETTYKHLLFDGIVTPRRPTLPKDKMYKQIGANLRECVINFTEHPWDKIAQREPFDEAAMRAAFTLREHKKHEQEALLATTLAAQNPPHYAAKKRKLEGMAMTLQRKRPKKKASSNATATTTADVEEARRRAEYLRQQKLQQQAKREAARRRREEEEEERREEEDRLARLHESPQQTLARCCQPVFQKLWDMEFALLQNTNPFRIVIDENNCAAMGAPDYMEIIKKPMNLSYIRDKLRDAKYDTLQDFFTDVELMLSNALLYNSDPNNAYHLAAKEMRRVYRKEGKELYQQLQKHAKR